MCPRGARGQGVQSREERKQVRYGERRREGGGESDGGEEGRKRGWEWEKVGNRGGEEREKEESREIFYFSSFINKKTEAPRMGITLEGTHL